MQTENEIHKLTYEILETHAQYILHGNGIQDIICKISKVTGCCSVLEDYTPTILAAGFAKNDSDDLLIPYFSIHTSPTVQNQPSLINNLNQQVLISDQYHDITINRLVTTVRAGSEQLGVLTLLKVNTPYSELETQLVRQCAHFIAALLAHDKKVAEIELRLKGNVVEDLVLGNYLDIESIQNRAHALEYDIMAPNRVLVAEIDESKKSLQRDKSEQVILKNKLIKKIQSVTSLTAKSLVVHRKSEIIILIQEDKTEHSFDTIKRLAEEIIREVSPLLKAKMYIGIGSSCVALADYKKSYLTARKALEVGEYMITEGQVRSFEQFKAHALFLSTLKPEALYAYAKKQLEPLLDYDEKHRSELIKTLQEFLYLRNNVEGTALSLNMSVSGIKYRLKRIETIIEHDLKDYKVCFDLQLALVILQLFGEYSVKT